MSSYLKAQKLERLGSRGASGQIVSEPTCCRNPHCTYTCLYYLPAQPETGAGSGCYSTHTQAQTTSRGPSHIISNNIRVGRDVKDHPVPPHLPVDQIFQRPIQPGLQHFPGWDIHNFSGNPFQWLTTVRENNFFGISNLI